MTLDEFEIIKHSTRQPVCLVHENYNTQCVDCVQVMEYSCMIEKLIKLARAENTWMKNCTLKNLEDLKIADLEVFGE